MGGVAAENFFQIDRLLDSPSQRSFQEAVALLPPGEARARLRYLASDSGKETRIPRSTKASIPFNVSFFADTPEVARSVAGELVSLYLNENLKKRGKKTAEVASGFLVQEQQRLAQHVPRLEAELAAHKERNVGRLPELMQLNLQQMERIERDLEETERQIFKAEERKIYLASKLAALEPTTGSSPARSRL